MSASKIIFDSVHKDKLPSTVRVIEYVKDNMSIDHDRWGTLFQVRDVFRILIKLKVI